MSASAKRHREEAPKQLSYEVITCSTSRYKQQTSGEKVTDVSGDLIESLLLNAKQKVSSRKLVPDDGSMIQDSVKSFLARADVDVIILCGGTGIAPSDVTVETVTPLLEKVLPGFGELFRRISYEEIGSAALMSRAVAGVAKGKAIFCIPGSPHAAKLCLERLIIPEAAHMVKHARE